jgi:S-disulfanyl-L-cysteine oxidoreductase SoxD
VKTLAVMGAAAMVAALAQNTASSGVYSAAQEKRGADVYARECSTCHGEKLKGGEGSPALTGSDFASGWNGQTLGDLFEKIKETMPAPPEQPGKLTPQQTSDVIAHMLSVNGFPAGSSELPSDVPALKRIKIDIKP